MVKSLVKKYKKKLESKFKIKTGAVVKELMQHTKIAQLLTMLIQQIIK
jgi:hypothetical protein